MKVSEKVQQCGFHMTTSVTLTCLVLSPSSKLGEDLKATISKTGKANFYIYLIRYCNHNCVLK